jgi:hypothetical protein
VAVASAAAPERHRDSLAAHTSAAQEPTVSAARRAFIPAALAWLPSDSRQWLGEQADPEVSLPAAEHR